MALDSQQRSKNMNTEINNFILETQKQQQIKQEYKSMTKNIYIAYACFFIAGLVSAHRFYLKKTDSALVFIGCLGLSHFCGALASIIIVMFFFDAFALPQMVREFNEKAINEKLNGKQEKKPFNLKYWAVGLFKSNPKTTIATVVLIVIIIASQVTKL